MSTYVREKVLRLPIEGFQLEDFKKTIAEKAEEMLGEPVDDIDDDLWYYTERAFPDIFDSGNRNKFQWSPTYPRRFIDYVLDYEWDCDGEYGKVRELYPSEKIKYLPVFQKLLPGLDSLDDVRLVEFCWYNGGEAPDYYDLKDDPFYKEV
jgi:hypothetical protein